MFRSDNLARPTPASEVVRTEDFFNQTAILVLKRGVALSGVVQNESGAPVPTATARMTTPENGGHSPVIAKVDAEGRFEFKKLKPGTAQLAVQAGGYAPDLRSVEPWRRTWRRSPLCWAKATRSEAASWTRTTNPSRARTCPSPPSTTARR